MGECTYTPIIDPAFHTSRFNITSVQNKIDNKLDDQFFIVQAMIDYNKKVFDEKMRKYYSKLDKQDSKLKNITAMIKNMMDHNQNLNYSPYNIYSPKDQGNTTVVPNNKRSQTLEGGYSTNNGCMRTIKHEIILPKLYELLINTEIKKRH